MNLLSEALHIVIFKDFVKSMTSCLSKLKVTPSFSFAFKIPYNMTATNMYHCTRLYFEIKAILKSYLYSQHNNENNEWMDGWTNEISLICTTYFCPFHFMRYLLNDYVFGMKSSKLKS